MKDGRWSGIAAVTTAVLVFSVTSSLAKWADAPGPTLALWRMLAAVVAWWLVLLVMNARTGLGFPSAHVWRRTAPAGVLFGANLTLLFTAINATSIAHAEFIGSLSPLLLLPAGAVLFGEHPDWRALRWGALSLAGIILVVFGGSSGGTARPAGDALTVLVLTLWVGYLLATKRARRESIPTVHFMVCAVPIAALTAAPITLALAGDRIWPLTGRDWMIVVLLAVTTGVGAHGLMVFAQRHLPVATIGILQVGQPALATFWAWLILGETISLVQVPGMVLVIAGLTAFTVTSQRRPVLPIVVPPPSLDEPAAPDPPQASGSAQPHHESA